MPTRNRSLLAASIPAVIVTFTVLAVAFTTPLSLGDSPSETATTVTNPLVVNGKRVPAPTPPPVDAIASTTSEMKPYIQPIMSTDTTIEMVPIVGGTFVMGSPDDEEGRGDDEGPQHEVNVDPFWMGKFELTWDQYDIWNESIDVIRRDLAGIKPSPADVIVDGMTRPTEPYTDMSFGFGRGRYPAICMTQHAARKYCEWLSAKTGFYYRLPTEAEWEFACRAGTQSAYSFGATADELDKYAVFIDNSDDQYNEVGTKEPNPWGLYDMHGNVSEWVLDQHDPETYSKRSAGEVANPLVNPKTLYPRVVRGGGWDNDAEQLRSAARIASDPSWKEQDPQIPQSIWYHTDALSVGFRIVRPLNEPTDEEKAAKWNKTDPLQIDE